MAFCRSLPLLQKRPDLVSWPCPQSQHEATAAISLQATRCRRIHSGAGISDAFCIGIALPRADLDKYMYILYIMRIKI
jgi:hypothetical protein